MQVSNEYGSTAPASVPLANLAVSPHCRAGASAPWHGGTRVLAAAAWASSVGSQQPSQHLQQLALPWHGFACHYAKGKGGCRLHGGAFPQAASGACPACTASDSCVL